MRRLFLAVSASLVAAGALLMLPAVASADGPRGHYPGRSYYRGGHGYQNYGRNYYRAPRYGYYPRARIYAPPVVRYGVPAYPSYGYPYGYGYGYPGFSIGFQGRNFSFYYGR